MKTRYPPLEPYKTGKLAVTPPHELYFEESGNPQGIPVVFLHGGPGSGTESSHRTYFDPKKYRIVLFDQRGCGKSTPHACLEHNTTPDLVEDIEKLRKFLQIEKWMVFGGSWGSTLALAYGVTHPGKVLSLVLRGIFLGRQEEIRWFYQEGAHLFFREEWEKYQAFIPIEERGDMVRAYYQRLTHKDPSVRREAAIRWASWEGVNLKLLFDPSAFATFTEDSHADAVARIECHYFLHDCFFPTKNYLLEQAKKIAHIPGWIVQGRYDLICPYATAWELSKKWEKGKLVTIPDAGHAASEKGIVHALVDATDTFSL